MPQNQRIISFLVLATAGILTLAACGSVEPPVFTKTTSAATARTTASAQKSPSASPRATSPSARPSPTRTPLAPLPTLSFPTMRTVAPRQSNSNNLSSDVAVASVKPIADFMAGIDAERAQSKEHQNAFTAELSKSIPKNASQAASNRQWISNISDTDIQPILQHLKDTLPYSNLVNFEGLSAQDQAYVLYTMIDFSVWEFEHNFVMKNIRADRKDTIVVQDGPEKILFRDLLADKYEGDVLIKTVLLDNGYDFAVIKTGDVWKIDGSKMAQIFEKQEIDENAKTS